MYVCIYVCMYVCIRGENNDVVCMYACDRYGEMDG